MTRPKPRTPVPDLELAALQGGTWKLSEQSPANFTMIVFIAAFTAPCQNISARARR
jgi:hypothetical protein